MHASNTNSSYDCISGHSPDILGHLCKFLDTKNILQVRKISKVLNKLVHDKVSVTFETRYYQHALRLVSVFKKIKLKILSRHNFSDRMLDQLAKHIISVDFAYSTITEAGLQSLVNLNYLDNWSNNMITDAGLQSLVDLTAIRYPEYI